MSKQTSTPTYKNVLFLVTGMTPQIVTETVWALACDPDNPDKWVPDEIHIFSTEQGFNQIKKRLFTEGVFAQMQKDYPQLQNTRFDERFFHYITQGDQVLPDVTTPAHNEVMANSLCKAIGTLCEDKDSNLHVSLAGGRKTMGFYAGYALSLYGRSQDRLSHVLVDPQYEKASDFFYPTIQEYLISDKDGKVLNAQDAQVWLSQIPFVRMRGVLDDDSIIAGKEFSEVVATIENVLKPITIRVDSNERLVYVGDISCKLSPKEFSLYLLAIEWRQQGKALYHPSKDIDGDTIDKDAMQRFNQIYQRYKSEQSTDILVDFSYFSNALSTMKRKFKKAFGKKIAEKIAVQKDNELSGYSIVLPLERIIN